VDANPMCPKCLSPGRCFCAFGPMLDRMAEAAEPEPPRVATIRVRQVPGGWEWTLSRDGGAVSGFWPGDCHHAVAAALSHLPDPADGVWRVDVRNREQGGDRG
jgi:hypothetical protein